MELDKWEYPDQPAGFLLHPDTPDEWRKGLEPYLGSRNDSPLLRCLQVALDNKAMTMVIETRYIDVDYRSEYSAYFSRLFKKVPSSTHRVHFFSGKIKTQQIWDLPRDHGYLGYVVIRPTPNGPISRAMLRPPKDIYDAMRAQVTEEVSFFGQPLEVTGVPFAQQDTQLGSCAHAAAWMCHYTAHLRQEVERRPRAEFSLLADASLHPSRSLPTQGLTVTQLSDLFRRVGLPAIFYALGSLPSRQLPWGPSPPSPPENPTPHAHPIEDPAPGTWDRGVVPVICRYLNSGVPVLVGTEDHAFVICGYRREPSRPGWVEFYRNDDQRGPYLPIADVLADVDPVSGHRYKPWQTLHVPLPEKIWLSAENAEAVGGRLLRNLSELTVPVVEEIYGSPVDSVERLITKERLALRTYVIRSNEFKSALATRGVSRKIIRLYRVTGFSRFV